MSGNLLGAFALSKVSIDEWNFIPAGEVTDGAQNKKSSLS
jgi:hypothetical protein